MIASRALRVVLDAIDIAPRPTGLGTYALELGRALARRDDIELTTALAHGHGVAGTRALRLPAKHRQLWRQLAFSRPRVASQYDLYHGAEFGAPVRCPVPRVVTVHDVGFLRMPRAYSVRERLHFVALLKTGLRAQRIITPSAEVARQLVAITSYPVDHVAVVPEAPKESLLPATAAAIRTMREYLGIEAPYLLCVGFAERRKRVVDCIRSLAVLDDWPDLHLVITGEDRDRMQAALQREAVRLGIEHRVRFVGYQEESLAALYSGALAVVHVSADEGFGLPPLEAMACDAPVIASDTPVFREVLGEAALLAEVRSPLEIARLVRILEEPAAGAMWRAKGRRHASGYSWDRAAAVTIEVYRELV